MVQSKIIIVNQLQPTVIIYFTHSSEITSKSLSVSHVSHIIVKKIQLIPVKNVDLNEN